MGASVIEKHFVLKGDETVDSFFSLTIDSFKDMVQKIRNVELSLGSVNYELTKEVEKNIWAKRSLYFSKDVKEGEKIKNAIDLLGQDMAHPKYFDEIASYVASKDVEIGDRVDWDSIKKLK